MSIKSSVQQGDVDMQNDIIGLWEESLEFEHWDILLDEIKYIAKDEDGEWWGFAVKPIKEDNVEGGLGVWILPSGSYSQYDLEAPVLNLFPECSWENSLIKRPE